MKRFLTSLISTVSIMALLTGCASSVSSESEAVAKGGLNGAVMQDFAATADEAYDDIAEESYEYEAPAQIAAKRSGENQSTMEDGVQKSGRKLIRTMHIGVETTDYDALIMAVSDKVNALGGYLENMDESVHTWTTPETRDFSATIRVPKDKADEFIEVVESSANVLNRSENTEDVTLNYVDTQSRKNALETEQKRLTELMEKAESVEDLITIESRLSEVRYQIQSIESQLRTYDNKIDYTTIYLTITEVERIVPKPKETFLSRITVGFSESIVDVWEGLVNFIAGLIISIPYLLVWAVILFLIWFIIIRNIIKHCKKRGAEKEQKKLEREIAREAGIRKAMEAKAQENAEPDIKENRIE